MNLLFIWYTFSGGGLSFGDVNGKVNVLSITNLNDEKVVFDKELAIWTQEDKILVDKITVISYENRTYILVVKQNVLVIFGINEQGIIFDQKVEYVEEYYITGYYF